MVCFDNPEKQCYKVWAESLILKWSIAIGLILLMPACSGQKGPEVKGFDSKSWMDDPNGCTGQRREQVRDLEPKLKQLKGLNNQEIMRVLGKPDRNELYKRNQKFFIYYISAAEACGDLSSDTSSVYLSIRFNALGLSSEAVIYK